MYYNNIIIVYKLKTNICDKKLFTVHNYRYNNIVISEYILNDLESILFYVPSKHFRQI